MSDDQSNSRVDCDIGQSESRRAPWERLVLGYLFITGAFGTLRILLELPSLTWSIRHYFGGDFRWLDDWAWANASYHLWRCLSQFLFLGSAIFLWRRPQHGKRVVFMVAAILFVGAVFSALTAVGVLFTLSPNYEPNERVQMAIWHTHAFAVPLFAAWFALRVDTFRRPHVTLLLGYMVILACFQLGIGVTMLARYSISSIIDVIPEFGWGARYLDIHEVVSGTASLLQSFALLAGAQFLARHRPRFVAASYLFLASQLIAGVPDGLALGMDIFDYGPGVFVYLSKVCHPVSGVVQGVLLVGLAYRLGLQINGHCARCDYNLTGNESGVCPECGKAVEGT